MHLTILGGGGFRVPLVYRALLGDTADERVTTVRLYDTDTDRLEVITRVLREQAEQAGGPAPKVEQHTDLADAIRGTDFIFSAMRVGGVEGRVADERIALDNNVIGQETVGAGGMSYALRTIPVAAALARLIDREAPDAWTINFTNPAGVITETMSQTLGDRVIGICDSPVGMAKRVLASAGLKGVDAHLDYIGLNHLGWLRALTVDGVDVLPGWLADADRVASIEEGQLFGAEWIRNLGAVPNEYLHYYYFTREALAAIKAEDAPRGTFIAEQQRRFYQQAITGDCAAFPLWHQAKDERERTYMSANRAAMGSEERSETDMEGGGYDQVALQIMHAIAHDEQVELILNVRNNGTIPDLDDHAVIEVPAIVDALGPRPLPTSPLPDYARGLVQSIKYCDRMLIQAGTTGSAAHALRAFGSHPLIDSVTVGKRILSGYRAHFRELDYLR